jgi:hypothetical protein
VVAALRTISAMKYALVVIAFLMISCNSSSSTPTETQDLVTQQFTLRYGQSAAIAGSSLRVRFAEPAEESRCPRNVVCVWMGNAKIRLDVTSNGRTESVFLNTAGNSEFPREATVFGTKIRLVDLQPYPEDPQPNDPTRYSAQLEISSP